MLVAETIIKYINIKVRTQLKKKKREREISYSKTKSLCGSSDPVLGGVTSLRT